MGWRSYRKGYSGFDYHVTGGHEAEAEAAQRGKRPSRLGLFVLRFLGYKGTPAPRPRTRPFSPHREKPHHP
jgi:hypothetical protein